MERNNKIIIKKKKTPLIKRFESNFIGQKYLKLRRGSRSLSTADKVEPVKVKTKKKKSKLKVNLPRNARNYVLAVIAALILGGVFFNILHYFSITPTQFNNSEFETVNQLKSNQFNIVYLGFEDRDDYLFLHNIVVESVNTRTGKVKHVMVNPNFTHRLSGFQNTFTFKTLYNNFQITEESKMSELVNVIQSFLGIRIDRYVAFKHSDLKRYISENNVESRIIEESVLVDGRTYKKGDKVKGENLNKYLFDEQSLIEGKDSFYLRFLLFFNKNVEQKSNYFNMYKLFWSSSELVKTYYTNMSREELFYIARVMISADFPVEYQIVGLTDAMVDEKSIDNGYIIDQILVDEKIGSFLRNVDILTEQAKIEIFNGSELSGLAYLYKRIYENSGSKVVKYGNYNQVREKTIVYVTKNDFDSLKNTLDMIQKSFDFPVEVTTEGYNENYSGDIVIILGKDIAE